MSVMSEAATDRRTLLATAAALGAVSSVLPTSSPLSSGAATGGDSEA